MSAHGLHACWMGAAVDGAAASEDDGKAYGRRESSSSLPYEPTGERKASHQELRSLCYTRVQGGLGALDNLEEERKREEAKLFPPPLYAFTGKRKGES